MRHLVNIPHYDDYTLDPPGKIYRWLYLIRNGSEVKYFVVFTVLAARQVAPGVRFDHYVPGEDGRRMLIKNIENLNTLSALLHFLH